MNDWIRMVFATVTIASLSSCALSNDELRYASSDGVIRYDDYAAYPKAHYAWGQSTIQVYPRSGGVRVNDVTMAFDLTTINGWRVLNANGWISLGMPTAADAASSITTGDVRLVAKDERELSLFGVRVRATEIHVLDLETSAELAYLYASPNRGIVAVTVFGRSGAHMYILGDKCGLMAPSSCGE